MLATAARSADRRIAGFRIAVEFQVCCVKHAAFDVPCTVLIMFSYLSSGFQAATGVHPIYVKLKSAATTIRAAVAAEATDIPHLCDEVIEIPSRDAGRNIKVDVYRPAHPHPSPRYLINFYGSFFVIDALQGSDVEFLQEIAARTGYTVYDVHYRLSPEYPFPAAIQDGEDVVRSLAPECKVVLSGFGAGGTLALSLASSSAITSRIQAVCAFYPPVDLSLSSYSEDLRAPDPSVPPRMSLEAAAVLNECYLYHNQNPRDPKVSPAFAPPESFPQDVFFFTAAQDVYCLSGEALVNRLQGAGKNVRHKRFDGCASLFDKQAEEGSVMERATREAYGRIVDYLNDEESGRDGEWRKTV